MKIRAVDELIVEVDRLPASDKWQLVRYLLGTLEQEQTVPTSLTDYHEFLRKTYGSLRDTPIERYAQGEYDERESVG
jgi:hypothetical protein